MQAGLEGSVAMTSVSTLGLVIDLWLILNNPSIPGLFDEHVCMVPPPFQRLTRPTLLFQMFSIALRSQTVRLQTASQEFLECQWYTLLGHSKNPLIFSQIFLWLPLFNHYTWSGSSSRKAVPLFVLQDPEGLLTEGLITHESINYYRAEILEAAGPVFLVLASRQMWKRAKVWLVWAL
ncbi:hypothetical protein SISNIDRAFT_470105 [Sistotremastrum niveocremeum HHB9708]|uniref:Uncharacterized protein n=1 Tax=Sistotremastrum niveocremeum HHB9708 TaxID=1314777 RepID=A0A164P8X4_9AGAM|nr:hypothetical protein SISNIDRAFT_470105 [Sistotremastrum niveocremeum HHB9708]